MRADYQYNDVQKRNNLLHPAKRCVKRATSGCSPILIYAAVASAFSDSTPLKRWAQANSNLIVRFAAPRDRPNALPDSFKGLTKWAD